MTRRLRRLRVVCVVGSARPGGSEGQLVRLARELRQREVDVRVLFTTFGGPLTAQLDGAGVPWEVLRPSGIPTSTGRNIAGLMRLCWRLLTWQPDIVLAWLAAAVWVTLPLTAVLTRARRVAGFRGEVFERDVGLAAGLFRHAVKHAHAVTINSPSLRKEALRWGAVSERIFEIPNGVDVPAVTANVEPDPPTAVVVANFRDYKGHDVLIDALALVRVPVIVRLIGEGDRRDRTRVRALELGLGDSVVFVESPADVAQELSNAQFAIHPSRTEGLPNAILEELATGLPVVATDVGGTSLLVSNGVTGFLVPAGDAVRLAHGIGELAASGELRASMTGAAKSRAREFTWDKSASRHLDLFSMLTGRGP